jgi:predicted ATPase
MKIKSLELKNYRCFKETAINFSDITILTGANSSGKSTVITAILLYLQSEHFPFYLNLNGKYINLGDFPNIAHTEQEPITFIFQLINEKYKLNISASWEKRKVKGNHLPIVSNLLLENSNKRFIKIQKEKNSYLLSMNISTKGYIIGRIKEQLLKFLDNQKKAFINKEEFILDEHPFKSTDDIIENVLFNKFYIVEHFIQENDYKRNQMDSNFNYIGSFRLEPQRTYYQKNAPESKIDSVGNGYIDTIIKWEQDNSEKLLSLKEILKDLDLFYDLKVNYMQGGRVELKVKTFKSGKLVNISDVGFGISQFLPIIVADLQLSDDSLLAISQPEIHLHPSIQAKFSEYIALQVKKKRKQYIIETHSEYILNRLRLLITKKELKEENVSTYYFENSGKESKTYKIDFSKDGKILNAPKGFFETYMLDVMDIALNA